MILALDTTGDPGTGGTRCSRRRRSGSEHDVTAYASTIPLPHKVAVFVDLAGANHGQPRKDSTAIAEDAEARGQDVLLREEPDLSHTWNFARAAIPYGLVFASAHMGVLRSAPGVKRFGRVESACPAWLCDHAPARRPAGGTAGGCIHSSDRPLRGPLPTERGRPMRSRRSLLSGAALAAAVVALGATSLISTAAQAATPPGLHVSGTQLVEKDGTPFVARGVSHAHTWYTSQTATAIPAIRAAGANALRVVLSDGTRWTKNDATDVANIICLCKANKLICMLEDHDTTGYGEQGAASTLDTAANYWISQAPCSRARRTTSSQHRQRAVRQQRHRDTSGRPTPPPRSRSCAPPACTTHHGRRPGLGSGLEEHHARQRGDRRRRRPGRQHRFSIHMYGVYNTAVDDHDYLDAFKAAGLPLIIGEFGYVHSADVDDAHRHVRGGQAEHRLLRLVVVAATPTRSSTW